MYFFRSILSQANSGRLNSWRWNIFCSPTTGFHYFQFTVSVCYIIWQKCFNPLFVMKHGGKCLCSRRNAHFCVRIGRFFLFSSLCFPLLMFLSSLQLYPCSGPVASLACGRVSSLVAVLETEGPVQPLAQRTRSALHSRKLAHPKEHTFIKTILKKIL